MREYKNISEKKKRIRLPVHIYLLYLLAATLIFTGVTFSKYLVSTNAGDSARVVTFGDLELVEADKPEKYIITPGVNISKNPLMSFGVNKPSETAVYVFVSVDANGWNCADNRTYTIARDNAENLMIWSVAHDWTYLTTDHARQIFYRTVPAGGSISGVPVISGGEITVSEKLYASDLSDLEPATKSIIFQAYAVQTQGFDSADAAWSDVNGK